MLIRHRATKTHMGGARSLEASGQLHAPQALLQGEMPRWSSNKLAAEPWADP